MTDTSADKSATAPMLPGLSRQRLADQIAGVLREQMLTGTLNPGNPIHERETAEALGVSRTPLREAILILEAEGLVETSPARSPIVADPSLDELTDLLVVLAHLEALAGELACTKASDEDLAEIRKFYQWMVDHNDGPDTVAYFKTDMAFHRAIVEATGNQPLIKTHQQYNARLWRARYMSSRSRMGRIETMRDHGDIIAALEARDGARTASVLRRHLTQAIRNISRILSESSETDVI